MRRRSVLVFWPLMILLLSLFGVASANAQLMGSFERLIHINTENFDIYAPRGLATQAQRLAGFADGTYAMLCEFFGSEKSRARIPVLVTDYQYSLNAFTTLYPSNRIVIFLASADPRSQLATLQDELYSVFLHELVHYVTLNERTPGWRVLAWLGGDWVAPEVWMMPQAIVEGTAVWAESRMSGPTGDDMRRSGSGRLNDPAALELVRLDRVQGEQRKLWEVSGLNDFYGSESLPYLYGGLFVDYLSERFGAGIIGKLWSASADGNLFRGFDGTLTSAGILERQTGEKPSDLWSDFLLWIDAHREPASEDGGKEIFKGYVGAMGAGNRAVFFMDLERRAVYRIDAEGRRERLFTADENLRNIFFNVKFARLDLDWIRTSSTNQQIPARYHFNLADKALKYVADLPKPSPSEALVELTPDPNQSKFLYDPWIDSETGISYGLGRLGSMVLPSRRLPDGRIEYVDIQEYALRWMSQGFRTVQANDSSIRFALQVVPVNGLSRLAMLEQKDGIWTFSVQKAAVQRGVHQPVFLDDRRIVYRSSEMDGRTSLRLVDTAQLDLAREPVKWISLSEWMKYHPDQISSSGPTDVAEKAAISSAQFPSAFSTSRIPHVNGSFVGMDIIASDLTERLSWSILGGWDFETARPATSVSLQFGTGAWKFGINAADQAVPTSPAARRSSAAASLQWRKTLVPAFQQFSTSFHMGFAGIQSNYLLSDIFSPAPEYAAFVSGFEADFSSLYASRSAPYDQHGFFVAAGAEYEFASIAGFGGAALFGSAVFHGWVSASLYSAVAPFGGIAFAPGIRYLESAGSAKISAADIPYPEYFEYRSYLTPSNWYVYGEAETRIFSLEIGSVIRLPYMPSVGIRRITGTLGLRGAGLDIASSPGILSSAFAQLTADTALLAGLGGSTHMRIALEGTWAFQPDKADGTPFHLSGSVRASLK